MNDRARQGLEFWGLLIVAVVQLCTLIWVVSSISRSVETLGLATQELKATAAALAVRVGEVETQVRILRDRETRP